MTSDPDANLYEVPDEENRKIPLWLSIPFIVLTLWGLYAFFAYWNGSKGWLDRGYWQRLQQAAHTTYPFERKDPSLMENQVAPPESLE